MFVHNTFISVWFAEWPPFGKELRPRLAMYSQCIFCLFVILVISRLGFEGWVRFFVSPVPVHCLLVTFENSGLGS